MPAFFNENKAAKYWQTMEVPYISDLYLNDSIRDKEIRLVGSDGEPLGIVSIEEAKRMAIEQELDLVNIAPKAKPPVCKIMDYSKYKFELSKKVKEAKKKQKMVDLKEVRLSPNTDVNDINIGVKKAIKFLQAGSKVKITIRFRYGRELGRTEHARNMLNNIGKDLEEYGNVEKMPKMEARSMSMYIAPKA